MEYLFEDCKSLLEQVNLQEKELRHKRRWLIGLPTSLSESGKLKGSRFQIERPIHEYLLRDDDVSYETIKSFVEKLAGYHIHQDDNDIQLIHSPTDIVHLFSLIDDMTNQGLFSFAKALTGGALNFEKTRSKMKQIIKKRLNRSNTREMKLPENCYSLLKNPHNFRWTSEYCFIPHSDSYRPAVHKILDILETLPTQTLTTMHRKLRGIRGYTPQLIPKKSGWGREILIKHLRKKCYKLLSKLHEGDSLQEPLIKAMEVAGLTLKLIQGHCCVTNFKPFSPEIRSLQNEIAMGIQLLDKKLKTSVLKDIQVRLDPNTKAKLSDRNLKWSIKNVLTEYLFECADMDADRDAVPPCVIEVLSIIKKNTKAPCKHVTDLKIEEEVECILSLSASTKQVLWDLLPEHELDLEFADAYMENLEESDICEDIEVEDDDEHIQNNTSNLNNLDEEVGSTEEIKLTNSECMAEIRSTESYSTNLPEVSKHVMQYHLVSLRNTDQMDTDSRTNTGNQDGFSNIAEKNMCENQHLAVQAASDEASMLAYRLIGRMLDNFAQMEDCELNSGDLSYLGDESYDLKQKDRRAVRKEPDTHMEDDCSILVKAVEELIPSFPKREADILKELMG